MSASDATENAILNLIFRAAAWADIAANDASDPATQFWLSLHTADPTDSGTQASNETAYTGYARIAIARSSSGWSEATAGSVANVAEALFGACSASPGAPVTHIGIGKDETGAGVLISSTALTAPYQPAVGNAPRFAPGAITVTHG